MKKRDTWTFVGFRPDGSRVLARNRKEIRTVILREGVDPSRVFSVPEGADPWTVAEQDLPPGSWDGLDDIGEAEREMRSRLAPWIRAQVRAVLKAEGIIE